MKTEPIIVQYRDYTQFSYDNFRETLPEKLCLENINTNSNGLAKLLQVCMNTLDQMAPRKRKYIRGNNMPFLHKELSSAHKKRTQLRNRYLRKRSYQNKRYYTKQRNFVFLYYEKIKKSTMPI